MLLRWDTVLVWVLLVWWAYWFLISLFGFGRVKRRVPQAEPQKRFLLLVPAHNEETVIGSLVDNLNNLDYPDHLYTVCVIADNCTDRTAQIARRKGAMVIEHYSRPGEPRGKPYAIRYALDQLGDDIFRWDAVAFFDADNLVSLNYLREMNNHLVAGDRLIQCYLDSKNPEDNWITMGYATSYYYMNRSWQLAKYRLGLGVAIGGTGFCVDVDLLRKIGWTARSLTEDLEFTMQCLLEGVKATWCHFARVYDEKPTGFIASCVQRLRWARGHWDVCLRYTPALLWRFIRKLDLKALDAVMYLVNPGKIVVGFLVSFVYYATYLTADPLFKPVLPMWVWTALIIFQVFYVAGCALADSGRRVRRVAQMVLSLFALNYTYVPLFLWALLTLNNRIWVRTDHKRELTAEEKKAIGM